MVCKVKLLMTKSKLSTFTHVSDADDLRVERPRFSDIIYY